MLKTRKPIAKSAAYSRITLTLPTFVILAVRQMVKNTNAKHPTKPPWTFSILMERWLLESLTNRNFANAGKEQPKFKRAAETWMRFEAQQRIKRKRPAARRKR